MKLTISTSILLIATALLISAFMVFHQADSAGWVGFQSHIQSATSTTVGTTAVTLFADNSPATCHSRVISTTDLPIMISFDEGVAGHSSSSLSQTVGHYQAGSTTVAYDAGLYGCGHFTARAGGNTTVTISSF